MFPYLYFLDYKIELYSTLNFMGMFILVTMGIRWNYRYGSKYPIGLGILFLIVPSAAVLARLFFFMFLACSSSKMQFFNLTSGGYMALGTIFGGIMGALIYFEFKKIPKIEGIEIFIPYIPIGGIFSRLGCFCTGCCYGTITNSIFGLRFPMGSPAWA
ncbi:MAG: prolipoprotein diacylglyceryl transferase, partial [bacterium]|nr:prolipoprotein diacylglyceryl transferase [bacterium]